MAIPAARIDDKVQATKFTAFGGLVVSVDPHYCLIGDEDVPQVQLSPVVQADFSTRRVCLNTDISLDIDSSYSPFEAIAFYRIQWGDGADTGWVAWAGGPGAFAYGAAGGEWPAAGVYTVTISVRDDSAGGVGGPFDTTIEEQIEVVDCTAFPFAGWVGLDGGGVYSVGSPWVARNTGLAGDWLTIYDIDVTYPGQVWIATGGGVAVSTDSGVSWRKLALEDPEDTWSVGVTAALLNYTMIARDYNNPDKCYIIAEWDSDAPNEEWVGYLLYTDDNFDTWTFKPLGGAYQAVATWGYVQQIPLFWTAEGDQNDAAVSLQVNIVNATGAPNGQYGGVSRTYTNRTGALSHAFLYEVILDLGAYITLDGGTVDGGINAEMIIGEITDTMTYAANEPDITLWASTGGADLWHVLDWDGAVDGYPPATPSTQNDNDTVPGFPFSNNPFRHLKISHSSAAYTGSGTYRLLIDGVRVYPDVVYNWFRPLSISVDKLTGRYLYMTMNNMYRNTLLAWDTNDMTTWIDEIPINGELHPSYRQAKVLSPKWSDAEVSGYQTLVWGDLGGGGTGIELVYAIEYGTPFTQYGYPLVGFNSNDVTPGGTSDYDGGAEWPLEQTIYVGRDTIIRFTIDQGTNWNALGITTGANFAMLPQVEGLLSPDWEEEFILGNRDLAAGNADRLHYTMDNAVTWFDVSTGLPATDVRVVRLVSEG